MNDVLLQYGALGVMCTLLVGAVVKLYRDNQAYSKEVASLQQARVDDAKEANNKLTQPLELLSRSVQMINEKIETAKRSSR